jgi:hypothetical protein
MRIPSGGEAFLYAAILAKLAFLGKLGWLGLIARYPATAGCVVFSACRTLGALYLAGNSVRVFGIDGYGLFYVATQPILWAFYFFVVLELYTRALEEFPGLCRLGRLMMFSSLAGIAVASASLILVDERAGIDPYPFLGYLALQERSIFIALSALTLVLLFFLGYFRVPVRRNVWTLWLCFGGYFLFSALLLTLRWYFGAAFAGIRSFSNAAFYLLALLGGIIWLSPAGETEVRFLAPPFGGPRQDLERALSLELQNFNAALVKVLRK